MTSFTAQNFKEYLSFLKIQLFWKKKQNLGELSIYEHYLFFKCKDLQLLQTKLKAMITSISLPVGTNGKSLAAIGKFPNAIGKLTIGRILATNEEKITNAFIGNDFLAIYW